MVKVEQRIPPVVIKVKKIKRAILDTGGNLKFTVRSFWEQILIQPIFEQIVSKVDFYNSKSTTEMCRVIQPPEVGEFQCNACNGLRH